MRKREGVRGSYEILDEAKLLSDEEIANLSDDEKLNGIDPNDYYGRHFLPYDKGGESDASGGWLPNYYVPTGYFIDWSKDAVNSLKTATIADIKIRNGKENEINNSDENRIASRFQSPQFYFSKGVTFSDTGTYSPTFRQSADSVFDQKGSVIIPTAKDRDSILALVCSTWAKYVYKNFVNGQTRGIGSRLKSRRLARTFGQSQNSRLDYGSKTLY